ncbi:Tn3 family transposase [Streptomyces europaeiscabiei]|uniref:Tn3 family transposase n=1 Tax=Streptomyces europaeiscabiei TaxID=146819 RepID=UPI000765C378|nr:Tn3 family transposase [Streptomyces europaeiscabiei]MDX2524696.1 Tn3 family transposase [Streptomyces europaeiscabiei]
MAQPGGRPARRLRGQPGRPLRGPGPATGRRSFITALQGKLRTSLDRFEQALDEGTTGVAIVRKHGEPWIRVSPRGKQEEPESLVAIKAEIERRWGTIDLLDILKYAEFDTDFIAEFASVATRENLSKDVLRRRLLLVLFGLGTNMASSASRSPASTASPSRHCAGCGTCSSTGPTCAPRW